MFYKIQEEGVILRSFVKNNKLITICCMFSVLIIILYIGSLGKKEIFSHVGDWFSVIFQLAIGFIINFIFYVSQVYVPQIRQRKQAYRCIYKRISKVKTHMNTIFVQLGEKYVESYDNKNPLTEQQLSEICHNLNFSDEISVVNIQRIYQDNSHFTVKEWLLSRIQYIESEINKLYLYYATYISSDLMEVFEKILESPMHQNMARSFLQSPINISFKKGEDIFFEPYYKLMQELEKVGKMYKM